MLVKLLKADLSLKVDESLEREDYLTDDEMKTLIKLLDSLSAEPERDQGAMKELKAIVEAKAKALSHRQTYLEWVLKEIERLSPKAGKEGE